MKAWTLFRQLPIDANDIVKQTYHPKNWNKKKDKWR
jgi:hypothetical protein